MKNRQRLKDLFCRRVEMKSRLVYILVYVGMWLFSLLPFRLLYLFSDINYFFTYYIVRYRRSVTRQNLRNSFPHQSKEWRKRVEKRFYHYICDYLLEEIKLMHLSLRELEQRMDYINKEEFLQMIDKYGGIVLMIPHYANFEWIIGMGSIMRLEDVPVQVYKPLHDFYLDRLFKKIRSKFGGYNVPKHSTVREIIKLKKQGKKMAIGLITDQSPNVFEAHYWTTFLNQDTVFMDGAEKIAKLMKFPVFYCSLTKKKRGYCSVEFQLLAEHPEQTADGEITELFARRVEQTIIAEPAYWFWSHRRWKRKREEIRKG